MFTCRNPTYNPTGVEVTISVLDPNNNFYEVDKTTSDENGLYKLAFVPEVPGLYTIYATFAGTESYWGSHAETAINVDDAPQATATALPQTQAPVETYFMLSTIAIILAVVIIGAILAIIMRKRP
jgi:hypothetical protein